MSKIRLEIDDCRRLTGENFFWKFPGAVIDAWVQGIDKNEVVNRWQYFARVLLDRVGWVQERTITRIFENGVSVALSAPIDALYAATEINECAWQLACAELENEFNLPVIHKEKPSLESMIEQLNNDIANEVNPALLSLVSLAEGHGAPCLFDDDEFSLGYGASAQVWPITSLPAIEDIHWKDFRRVPTVYVTGTNGKSTTVRLTSAIMTEAGVNCGVTSTDFIRVGQTIIDTGDYSGPGGARTLLRHPEAEMALLEVARGGLLRRGLPIPSVDVALVTNIADDHLGQYGINTLEALTQAKCIVAKALDEDGTLILNADDDNLIKYAVSIPSDNVSKGKDGSNNEASVNISQKNICWFSLKKDNPIFQKHSGDRCYLDEETMIFERNGQRFSVAKVTDVPMCLGGAAKHNIQNALGAIAIAYNLGIPIAAIRKGLMNFNSDANDNPGRGNIFNYRDATIVIDFAHNVHSMDAMAATWGNIPASKKYLLLCAAGDRKNSEIESMTASAMALKPDYIVAAELPNYLRGRKPGEISQLIADTARKTNTKTKIIFSESPLIGAEHIINQIQTGELALLMALDQRDEIADLLR